MSTPQCIHTTDHLVPSVKENDYLLAVQSNNGFKFKRAEEKDFNQSKHTQSGYCLKYSNIVIIHEKNLSENEISFMYRDLQKQLRGD